MHEQLTRVALAALMLSTTLGAAHAADDTALPARMVFFSTGTSCPAGSAPAAAAAGRLLLANTNPAEAGKTYGQPLGPQEDRTHTHPVTLSVTLPSHRIAAISGGGNGRGTNQGAHTVTVPSAPGTSGLPFIQLLVCEAH